MIFPEDVAARKPTIHIFKKQNQKTVVRCYFPGFLLSNLDVKIENGYLIISLSKSEEKDCDNGHEMFSVNFSRSIVVPENLTMDQVFLEVKKPYFNIIFPKDFEVLTKK